ncbi:Phospholipase/carboxylesterase [Multifurca ochricompacta]|uniref:Acyl-protein thioesterase 1 n=1 Tax=Multifurca ochricompacta TaxID=376703 RepID=A0AAD4MB89_9AGAM|nr:Phospholipase/carboxylesterase [Multifurca ochricompacta]
MDPPPLIFNSITKHTATVIFLHGLGDTGHGWGDSVSSVFRYDTSLSHVKWILPHAPSMSVTANFGMQMPAWFDITHFDFETAEDEDGMLRTVSSVNRLISAEVSSGIEPGRIVIGGFSQGAAMSLLTGLTNERKLGGIVSLSGWLVLRNKMKAMCSEHALAMPVFWGHGTADPLVTFDLGCTSVDFLKTTLGLPATLPDALDGATLKGVMFRQYAGLQHGVAPQELDDLKVWLKKILPQDSE